MNSSNNQSLVLKLIWFSLILSNAIYVGVAYFSVDQAQVFSINYYDPEILLCAGFAVFLTIFGIILPKITI